MVGNIPNFTKIDILRCFLRFGKNIGRQELARELELGEGTIRTILENLKSKKLLESTKKGHFLSKKGTEMLNQIYQHISMPNNIKMQNLYPNFKKVGILVRNVSNLKELYRLRDIAVKNGADGAVILKFDSKLYAPESDYEQDYKALKNRKDFLGTKNSQGEFFSELEKYFDFKNNDVLVIAFSNEKGDAENGALAVAIELSSTLKNFIKEF